MDPHIYVAIVAAMLNILLSLILPPLIGNSQLPFIAQVKKNYDCNRNVIFVSSILVILFVYISLKITPFVEKNIFANLAKLNNNAQLVKH
jgi:thiosulfate reductase cytochrome b subunit